MYRLNAFWTTFKCGFEEHQFESVSIILLHWSFFALPSTAINLWFSFLIYVTLSSSLFRTHLLQAVLFQAVILQGVPKILPYHLSIFQDPLLLLPLLFQALRLRFPGILQAGGRAPLPFPAGRLENGWHEDFGRDVDVIHAVGVWGRDWKVVHVWRIHPVFCTDGSHQPWIWRTHKTLS